MGEPRLIMEILVGTGRARWVKGFDLELHDHVGNQCVTQRVLGWAALLLDSWEPGGWTRCETSTLRDGLGILIY